MYNIGRKVLPSEIILSRQKGYKGKGTKITWSEQTRLGLHYNDMTTIRVVRTHVANFNMVGIGTR